MGLLSRRKKTSVPKKIKLAAALAIVDDAPDPAEIAQKEAETELCKQDCSYFIDKYCVIDDAQGHGDGSGTMPFKLWDAQKGVVGTLTTEKKVIILKARQLGISWLVCAYVLWAASVKSGQMILLFSQGEDEAAELLRRVSVLYDRLPDWLKASMPAPLKGNTSLLRWENGSRIKSMPATQKAGRSFTASILVMDEAAWMMWGNALYTAAKPTMDGGGQIVMLSTANGVGGLFHSIWTKATAKINDYATVFLAWWARPGRDQAWYDKVVAEETDPAKVKQEYPANPTEAFLASGRVRYPSEWIEAQAANVLAPLTPTGWPDVLKESGLDHRNLAVYALPAPRREYLISADVAEGLETGDYSTAPVIDRATGEEVATIHGHWEPDTFAAHLAMLGRLYNTAVIAVERNNHGHAVLATLRLSDVAYPRIAKGLDDRPGWLSNLKTKPHSVDLLGSALRDGTITIRSQATLDEMQIYRVLKDGKTGYPEGHHDDRVMSWAIAVAVMNMVPVSQIGKVGRPITPFQPIPAMRLPAPPRGIPGVARLEI